MPETKQPGEAAAIDGGRTEPRRDFTPALVVALDRAGRITLLNEEGGRILGCLPREVVSQDWFAKFVPEDERLAGRAEFARLLGSEGEQFAVWERAVVTLHGTRLRVRWRNSLLHDASGAIIGALCSGEELAEVARSPLPPEVGQERYEALLAAMPWAVFVQPFPDGGRPQLLQDANEAASRLLGYSRSELRHLSYADLVEPPGAAWPPDALRTLTESGAAVFRQTQRAQDGRTIPVEVHAHTAMIGGQKVIIAVARDFSERVAAEEERRKLEIQMQNAQRLESLGVLAGGIAHDFNNILFSVLGNISLLHMDLPPELPLRSRALEIELAARRAADLCSQLLAYAGRGRIVIESIDLNGLIQEMTKLAEVSVSKMVALRLELAEDVLPIEADATQIWQVLMNLVINASEAIGDRSGLVIVRTGALNLDRETSHKLGLASALPEGPYVFLQVADSGSGMNEETRARLFDPFFTTKSTGRGLGLAAVQGIVRAHKGAIRVESTLGRGSTFTVYLPSASPAIEGDQLAQQPPAEWRGSGTILVVDDDASVRALLYRMLERLGFGVLMAGDGRQGVDLLLAHADRIVAVLLDLVMPVMDGEEALREIALRCPQAQVILMSGYTEHELVQRFEGRGTAGFLQKPFSLEALSAILRPIMAARRTSERRAHAQGPAKGTILLVDDDAGARSTGQAVLQRLGLRVIVAENGRRALEEYQRNAAEIGAVILDQMMPEMDGAETFLALQEMNPEVAVLFACGRVDADISQQLLSFGALGFVKKPYTVDQMRAALEGLRRVQAGAQ